MQSSSVLTLPNDRVSPVSRVPLTAALFALLSFYDDEISRFLDTEQDCFPRKGHGQAKREQLGRGK